MNWFWWIVHDEALDLAVGRQEDRRGGHLVDVADLQADDPVLDVVDDPHAVSGAELGDPFDQLHELQALAVQGDGHAPLELDLHDLGLVGRALGGRDELEDVLLGRVVEVLDPAALRRASPEVVVDRIWRLRLDPPEMT